MSPNRPEKAATAEQLAPAAGPRKELATPFAIRQPRKSRHAVLPNAVRELRRERGLSQQELAQAAGVARQTIIALETHRSTATLRLALLLARALKCEVSRIFWLATET